MNLTFHLNFKWDLIRKFHCVKGIKEVDRRILTDYWWMLKRRICIVEIVSRKKGNWERGGMVLCHIILLGSFINNVYRTLYFSTPSIGIDVSYQVKSVAKMTFGSLILSSGVGGSVLLKIHRNFMASELSFVNNPT